MEQFVFDKDNMPLEEEEMSSGIKLKTNKSRFARKARVKAQFEQRVQDVQQAHEGHISKGYEISQAFMRQFVDKTLPDNKGPMSKSLEKESVSKFIDWVVKVNNDELEPKEGMGSSAGLTLLFNVVLKLRDNFNIVHHKNILLEEEVEILKKEIKDLSSRLEDIGEKE